MASGNLKETQWASVLYALEQIEERGGRANEQSISELLRVERDVSPFPLTPLNGAQITTVLTELR